MKISIRGTARAKGFKTYNTKRPCIKGHLSRRDTISGECLKCMAEERKYRKTDEYKEYQREYKKTYYQKNKEKLSKRQTTYFAKPANYKKLKKQLLPADNPREEPGGLLSVSCYFCKKQFVPTRQQAANRVQAIKGNYTSGDEHNFYCSDTCKSSCAVYRKSTNIIDKFDVSLLEVWAKDVKKKAGHACEICGSTKILHSHHIEPKSTTPNLAYDIENGMCLCRDCHFKHGHSGECSPAELSASSC